MLQGLYPWAAASVRMDSWLLKPNFGEVRFARPEGDRRSVKAESPHPEIGLTGVGSSLKIRLLLG